MLLAFGIFFLRFFLCFWDDIASLEGGPAGLSARDIFCFYFLMEVNHGVFGGFPWGV